MKHTLDIMEQIRLDSEESEKQKQTNELRLALSADIPEAESLVSEGSKEFNPMLKCFSSCGRMLAVISKMKHVCNVHVLDLFDNATLMEFAYYKTVISVEFLQLSEFSFLMIGHDQGGIDMADIRSKTVKTLKITRGAGVLVELGDYESGDNESNIGMMNEAPSHLPTIKDQENLGMEDSMGPDRSYKVEFIRCKMSLGKEQDVIVVFRHTKNTHELMHMILKFSILNEPRALSIRDECKTTFLNKEESLFYLFKDSLVSLSFSSEPDGPICLFNLHGYEVMDNEDPKSLKIAKHYKNEEVQVIEKDQFLYFLFFSPPFMELVRVKVEEGGIGDPEKVGDTVSPNITHVSVARNISHPSKAKSDYLSLWMRPGSREVFMSEFDPGENYVKAWQKDVSSSILSFEESKISSKVHQIAMVLCPKKGEKLIVFLQNSFKLFQQNNEGRKSKAALEFFEGTSSPVSMCQSEDNKFILVQKPTAVRLYEVESNDQFAFLGEVELRKPVLGLELISTTEGPSLFVLFRSEIDSFLYSKKEKKIQKTQMNFPFVLGISMTIARTSMSELSLYILWERLEEGQVGKVSSFSLSESSQTSVKKEEFDVQDPKKSFFVSSFNEGCVFLVSQKEIVSANPRKQLKSPKMFESIQKNHFAENTKVISMKANSSFSLVLVLEETAHGAENACNQEKSVSKPNSFSKVTVYKKNFNMEFVPIFTIGQNEESFAWSIKGATFSPFADLVYIWSRFKLLRLFAGSQHEFLKLRTHSDKDRRLNIGSILASSKNELLYVSTNKSELSSLDIVPTESIVVHKKGSDSSIVFFGEKTSFVAYEGKSILQLWLPSFGSGYKIHWDVADSSITSLYFSKEVIFFSTEDGEFCAFKLDQGRLMPVCKVRVKYLVKQIIENPFLLKSSESALSLILLSDHSQLLFFEFDSQGGKLEMLSIFNLDLEKIERIFVLPSQLETQTEIFIVTKKAAGSFSFKSKEDKEFYSASIDHLNEKVLIKEADSRFFNQNMKKVFLRNAALSSFRPFSFLLQKNSEESPDFEENIASSSVLFNSKHR